MATLRSPVHRSVISHRPRSRPVRIVRCGHLPAIRAVRASYEDVRSRTRIRILFEPPRAGSARPRYGGSAAGPPAGRTGAPNVRPRRRSPHHAGERESGGNPELSRSGEQERPPSSALGSTPGKRRPVGRPTGRCPRVRRPAGCTGYAVSGGRRLVERAPPPVLTSGPAVRPGRSGSHRCRAPGNGDVRRTSQHWRTP